MKKGILVVLGILTVLGFTWHSISKEAEKEEKLVSASEVSNRTVIPGGMPVGIYMDINGVLVVGTSPIQGVDKLTHEPAKSIVKEGDYIEAFNDEKVDSKKELVNLIEGIEDEDTMAVLTLRRSDERVKVKVKPVCVSTKEYKLGIWVRDNVQGLGTVTFVDKNYNYGALGHGIHDPDTNELLDMAKGKLYKTNILDIHKGESGTPGGLEGVIVYNRYNVIGDILKNNDSGIYGSLSQLSSEVKDVKPMEIASKYEIKEGKATMRCTVHNQIQEYQIEICKINLHEREVNKGLVIQITDKKLLQETGGIIQGMSGSPIIQNGKIVGAVTHVFVQDSSKGYGIFIENMVRNLE